MLSVLRRISWSVFPMMPIAQLSGKSSERMPAVVFVLGAPGSGKGTQCKKLATNFDLVHFSAGDLIRKERDTPGSRHGAVIAEVIKEPGTLIPAEITCELLENAMQKSGKERFLIDGFPNNQDNLDVWDRGIGQRTGLPFVLFLEVSEDVSVERCLGRKRWDDKEDRLRKRYQIYVMETLPIVNHYKNLALLQSVDGSRKPAEVYADIARIFEQKLASGVGSTLSGEVRTKT